MPNTYIEHLMARAEGHWGAGNPLPIDLFSEMLNAGIDVDAAERSFKRNQENA